MLRWNALTTLCVVSACLVASASAAVCSSYNARTCPLGNCTIDLVNANGCRDLYCSEIYDNNVCNAQSARGCYVDPTTLTCKHTDSGAACATLTPSDGCPTPRCAFDYTLNKCRAPACTDFAYNNVGCVNNASALKCAFDGSSQQCFDPAVGLPCIYVSNASQCVAPRCSYDPVKGCKAVGAPTACSALGNQSACMAANCSWNANLCTDPSLIECGTFFSAATCNVNPLCVFAQGRCYKCAADKCALVPTVGATTLQPSTLYDYCPQQSPLGGVCAYPCIYNATSNTCRTAGCFDYLTKNTCQSAADCVWNSTAKCHAPDASTKCTEFTSARCPARCANSAADGCVPMDCIYAGYDNASCTSRPGLKCQFVNGACSPLDDGLACSAHPTAVTCPLQRCVWNTASVEQLPSCDNRQCSDVRTNVSDCLAFQPAGAAAKCVYNNNTIFGSPIGCMAANAVVPCSRYGSASECANVSSRCEFDATAYYCKDKNTSTPCALFSSSSISCAAQNGRCVYDNTVYACGEANKSLPCSAYSAYPAMCNARPACVYTNARCYSCSNASCARPATTMAPTTPAVVCANVVPSFGQCPAQCNYDLPNNKCVDRSCRDIYVQAQCASSANCTWYPDLYACDFVDRGFPCASYSGASCPRARCVADGGGSLSGGVSSCRNKTCTDYYDVTACTNAKCQFEAAISYCHAPGPVPCSRFYSESLCNTSALCRYIAPASTCWEKASPLPCEKIVANKTFCQQSAGCTYAADLSLCINASAALSCDKLSNYPRLCKVNYSATCDYDDLAAICKPKGSNTSCAAYTDATVCSLNPACAYVNQVCSDCAAGYGQCLVPLTTTARPTAGTPRAFINCTADSQMVCAGLTGCAWNFSNNSCARGACNTVYDQASCTALGCIFNVNSYTCAYPDSGRPCATLDAAGCSAASGRCTASFDGITSCRNLTCDDQFAAAACLTFGGGGACTWSAYGKFCKKVGAPDPCSRFYDANSCSSSVDCQWNPLVYSCTPFTAPPACSLFQGQARCSTQGARCAYDRVAATCLPAGATANCSSYPSKAACATTGARCDFDTILNRCFDAGQPLACNNYYSAERCNMTGRCAYNASYGSCQPCPTPGACPASYNPATAVKPCPVIFANSNGALCPYDFCSNDVYQQCNLRQCNTILSPFCVAALNCSYDAATGACNAVGSLTACDAYLTPGTCPAGRCSWAADALACVANGTLASCPLYQTEAACGLAGARCLWNPDNFVCDTITTTTTTTTPTTTPYCNDACRNTGACFSGCQKTDCLGNYTCAPCPAGYTGNGYQCDTIKCPAHVAQLPANATYTSFFLDCPNSGYKSTCGLKCLDGFAQTAGDGNFVCGTKGTWEGNLTCTDINECASNPCGYLLKCTQPAPNSFDCGACPAGYNKVLVNGVYQCQDINECDRLPCDSVSNCTNTEGSYTCSPCPSGFEGNPYDPTGGCRDINECVTLTPCSPLAVCFNKVGSYQCGSCPYGFSGDGNGPNGCLGADCGAVIPADKLGVNVTANCKGITRYMGDPCVATCTNKYVGQISGQPVTSSNWTCSPSGTWQGIDMRCTLPNCVATIPGSSLDTHAYQVNASCFIKGLDSAASCVVACQAGYTAPVPPTPFKCNSLGEWVNGSITCQPCLNGTFKADKGVGPCQPYTVCNSETQYQSKPGTSSTDAVCSSLTLCIGNDRYEKTPPTATSNRVCEVCQPCAKSQYMVPGTCALGVARACAACITCPADGSFVSRACGDDPANPQTECKKCPYGEFGTATINTCRKWRVCDDGHLVLSQPTLNADRVCSDFVYSDQYKALPDELFINGTVTFSGLPAGYILTNEEGNLILIALTKATGDPSALVSILKETSSNDARRATSTVAVDFLVVTGVGNGPAVTAALTAPNAVANALSSSAADLGLAPASTPIRTATLEPVKAGYVSPVDSGSTSKGKSDNSLVIGVAVGVSVGVVVIIIIVAIVLAKARKNAFSNLEAAPASGKSAGAAGGEVELNRFAAPAARLAPITDDPAAFNTVKRSRQSSFYSSIGAADAEA